jgi:hypothetical protein
MEIQSCTSSLKATASITHSSEETSNNTSPDPNPDFTLLFQVLFLCPTNLNLSMNIQQSKCTFVENAYIEVAECTIKHIYNKCSKEY